MTMGRYPLLLSLAFLSGVCGLAYEVLYSDTPDRVAINEAVELAKRFGSAQSAQFVNGILDRLMHSEAGSG